MPDFNGSISSKLPFAGVTIFTKMTALANAHGALNLAQGFPDFDCLPDLQHLVSDAMKQGYNQYAPMQGLLDLREAISAKIESLYSAYYHPDDEITVTPGATVALYAAITAVVKEGDEVIIIEPAYDSYVPAVELNGGKAVFANLKYPSYQPDWDEIKKLINFKTKLIIINTPHNPTGTILSSADLLKLQKLVEHSDILILSDEVYEHIVFDGVEHQSIARFPKLAERSFVVSSFGKTYHTTGWKLGYCVAPKKLMVEFRKIYQFMAFSAHTPSQVAFAKILKNKELYLELGSFYQGKRDFFTQLMKGSKWRALPCLGSYFQLLGYKKMSDEKDITFSERLVKELGVASIPISVFYKNKIDDQVLRFCFAKSNETLEKAAASLLKV